MVFDPIGIGLIEEKLAVAKRLPVGPHAELLVGDVPGLDVAEPGGLAIGGGRLGVHRAVALR